ncbi:MAG: MerR family DNA-binding protein [Acidobacteriota bacterium]|nr:MerR family DNA-binding protein [Acidobacteriota bacterium]
MGTEFQIGEAARRAAVTVDAIRFYERRRLLPKAPRTPGRYRLYTIADVARLRFIRRVQALGFSLAEIQQLIELRERRNGACAPVRDLLRAKLADVRARLVHLHALENELSRDLRRCQQQLRQARAGRTVPCRVLAEMERQRKSEPQEVTRGRRT